MKLVAFQCNPLTGSQTATKMSFDEILFDQRSYRRLYINRRLVPFLHDSFQLQKFHSKIDVEQNQFYREMLKSWIHNIFSEWFS